MTETKVVIYRSPRDMDKGIKKMQKQGWEVASTETIDQGWSCAKVGCLAIIFFPLALLGKKPKAYKVEYRREKK